MPVQANVVSPYRQNVGTDSQNVVSNRMKSESIADVCSQYREHIQSTARGCSSERADVLKSQVLTLHHTIAVTFCNSTVFD